MSNKQPQREVLHNIKVQYMKQPGTLDGKEDTLSNQPGPLILSPYPTKLKMKKVVTNICIGAKNFERQSKHEKVEEGYFQ